MYNLQFTKKIERLGIDDSKRLTVEQREKLVPFINKYFYWGIGEIDIRTINRVGIGKATAMAMRKAIKNVQCIIYNLKLPTTKTFILVDGYNVKYLPGGMRNQKAIVKGDQKSISIAAASIIAKVYRDYKMRLLDNKYPQYTFRKHKGYGTKKHLEEVIQFGSTCYHRERFLTTFLR